MCESADFLRPIINRPVQWRGLLSRCCLHVLLTPPRPCSRRVEMTPVEIQRCALLVNELLRDGLVKRLPIRRPSERVVVPRRCIRFIRSGISCIRIFHRLLRILSNHFVFSRSIPTPVTTGACPTAPFPPRVVRGVGFARSNPTKLRRRLCCTPWPWRGFDSGTSS